IGDQRPYFGEVESYWLAGEQVVELDIPDLGEHHATFDQLGEGGHHTMPHARLRTMLRDATHHHTERRRDGHQHLMHLVGTGEPGELVARPDPLGAGAPAPLFAGFVAHESEPRHAVARAALDLLEESDSRAARPDDEGERVDASDCWA